MHTHTLAHTGTHARRRTEGVVTSGVRQTSLLVESHSRGTLGGKPDRGGTDRTAAVKPFTHIYRTNVYTLPETTKPLCVNRKRLRIIIVDVLQNAHTDTHTLSRGT